MRSNLFDMQESRLVAKRHKPAFWFTAIGRTAGLVEERRGRRTGLRLVVLARFPRGFFRLNVLHFAPYYAGPFI